MRLSAKTLLSTPFIQAGTELSSRARCTAPDPGNPVDQAFSHLHAGPVLGAQARTFLVREEKDRHFANPWLCCRWLSKTADERQNARFEPPFSTAQTGLSNDDPRQVADELRDCAQTHLLPQRREGSDDSTTDLQPLSAHPDPAADLTWLAPGLSAAAWTMA